MGSFMKSTPLIAGISNLRLKLLRECDKLFRENDYPMDLDQVSILLLLASSPGLSQTEIGARLQRDKGAVNRIVSAFSDNGVVEVGLDSKDQRLTRISLSAKGKKLAKQGEVTLVKYEQQLASVLSEEEYKTFKILVNKLLNNGSK